MRRFWLCSLLLVVLAAGLAAQPYAGDFIIAGSWYSTMDTVARIDRSTLKFSTLLGRLNTTSTSAYNVEVMMAENNSDFYVFSSSLKSVFLVDAAGTLLKTVFDGTAVLGTPYDMALDQNGDILIGDYARGIFRVDRTTGISTLILTTLQLGTTLRAITNDIDSGNLLIADGTNRIKRYDIVTGAVTSISPAAPGAFRYQVEQDHATGRIYTGTCCSTATSGSGMFVFDPSTQLWQTLVGATNPPLRAWYAHRFDRRVQSAGNNLIYSWVCGFAIANNFSALASLTEQGVITTLVTGGTPATGVLTAYGMEIEGSRNAVSLRTAAPNNRNIDLSFPNEGGKAYVAALGLSGVRPSIPLGDGRVVNLTPDQITWASLSNWLPGIFGPPTGVLDAFGRATLKLNANVLGAAIRGQPVWVAVVVLDPKASAGIAVVAETLVIKME
ncbi:MAG: hypothetical protein JXQ29_03155 [Planctomycetes bacterium]|nr:hypothetical protein [Planctomycetota bacterium]